jgi:hypothetical protein
MELHDPGTRAPTESEYFVGRNAIPSHSKSRTRPQIMQFHLALACIRDGLLYRGGARLNRTARNGGLFPDPMRTV